MKKERPLIMATRPAPMQNPNRPHDIRNRIPQTSFTSPAEFPMHVHRDYPKMLLRDNPDPKKIAAVPLLDEVEQPILVFDEGEEKEFLDNLEEENPELAAQVRRHMPKSAADKLEEENAVMRKLIADNEDLQRRLAAAEAKNSKPNPVTKVAESKPDPKPPSTQKKDKSIPAPLKAK